MLHRIWRRGSLAWQAVLYTAFLAMGLFVTFDLLDLDGSQLESRTLPRGARAVAFISSDAESVLFQDPSRLHPTSLAFPWQILRALGGSPELPGRLMPMPFTTRFDSMRRHPLPRTGTTPARPASEDPY